MFQLVEPFQGSFISTNDYPGWRGFAAYPGLRCATPVGLMRSMQTWNYCISAD